MTNANPFQGAHVLARARQGVATLEAGQTYTQVRCVVREVRLDTFRTGKNAGKPYLTLVLTDRTGEREAKCWEGAPLASQLHAGTVVEIDRVEVDDYGAKFEPRDLHIVPEGAYEPREFVPTLPQELIEQNWAQLHASLDTIENPHLQRLRAAVFGAPEISDAYKMHPSALHHHHNYLGGNVQHVLGLMRIVDAIGTSYPEIDRDVVLLGAAVHDLGKLKEYAVTTTITVTDEGRLKGHLVIGAEWLGQIVAGLRREGYEFPAGLEAHLVHMILSHHRKGEWGSPKPPATPEAMLLHLADYADSQTKGFLQEVERNQGSPQGWAQRWDSDAGAKLWFKTTRDWD